MAAPPRPTEVIDCFKSTCAMGLVGVSSSEGTLYCDLKKKRTRFEAFGGWSVTRFDLGVSASHYVKANPPDVKLHEEPMMGFAPPEDAVFGGVETVQGKDCQKWSFKQVGKAMTTEVDVWLSVDASSGVATPVVYRMKTPTQTIEMKFVTIEPAESMPDDLFAIEQYIPSEKPPTVSVRGVMTNEAGERVHGVTVAASHPDGTKAAWTTRTGIQSDEKGEFELLLTPGKVWRLTVQGAPKYNARIFEITPPEGGIAPGGAADVVMQPATGGQPAYGNPGAGGAGAYPNTAAMAGGGAATSSVGYGGMGGAGANVAPGMGHVGAMPPGYTTAPSMEYMQQQQARQQAAMAQAHAAMGQAAGQMNAAAGLMQGMGMGAAAAGFQQGAMRAQQGQHDVAMGAAQQQAHFNAAQPAMQFHAQMANPQAAQQQQSPPAAQSSQGGYPGAGGQAGGASDANATKPAAAAPAASSNEKDSAPAPAAAPAPQANESSNAKSGISESNEVAAVSSEAAAVSAAAAAVTVQAAAVSAAGAAQSLAEMSKEMSSKQLTCTAEKYSVGRTGLFSNWKKRVFKLSPPVVQYMEKDGSPPLGTITIGAKTKIHGDVTAAMHNQATEPARDALIEFQENNKTLKLLIRFASADEKREWVDAMNLTRKVMELTHAM